jgi:diguanylate cyclase (GGDEF)-like protein
MTDAPPAPARALRFRTRLGRALLGVCALALLATLAAFTGYGLADAFRTAQARLDGLGAHLAGPVAAAAAAGNRPGLAAELRRLDRDPAVLGATVLDRQGRPLALYRAPPRPGWSWAGRTLLPAPPRVERPLLYRGARVGSLLLEADPAALVRPFLVLGAIALALFLAFLAACRPLADRLARPLTGPVAALAATMGKVRKTKDFSDRLNPTGIAELDPLVFSCNALLAELAAREGALREWQDGLDQLAHFDPLTRLPNRTLFADRLGQAVQRAIRAGTQGAVLFLDLDAFKGINDRYGHPIGDLLLQEVARRLAAFTRGEDTLARLGGDEFTILVQDVKTAENALLVARKHVESLRAPFQLEQHRIRMSASIGVALYPDHGQDAGTLIRYADAAMYQAKKLGKDKVVLFTRALGQELSDRLTLGDDLRRAVAAQDLALHYQVRVDLGRVAVTGAEALLRWQHPRLGPVAPDRFLPLAEQTGLALPLGEWTLREACRDLGRWRREGISLARVSVNLFAAQLQRQDLAGILAGVMAAGGLGAGDLELEAAEPVLMENLDQSRKVLTQLKDLGARISVDGFGTGYSSLSLLRALPLDALKIDRSLVHRLPESREDRQVLGAILAMAGILGLEVVAEGVETPAQHRILLDLGCREAQGFLFAPALPGPLLPRWFQDGPDGEEARRSYPACPDAPIRAILEPAPRPS